MTDPHQINSRHLYGSDLVTKVFTFAEFYAEQASKDERLDVCPAAAVLNLIMFLMREPDGRTAIEDVLALASSVNIEAESIASLFTPPQNYASC